MDYPSEFWRDGYLERQRRVTECYRQAHGGDGVDYCASVWDVTALGFSWDLFDRAQGPFAGMALSNLTGAAFGLWLVR